MQLGFDMDRAVQRLRRAARIILVGAPGVGKGTQTERLIKRYPQLSAISSGDLLRNNVRERTPLGPWHLTESRRDSGLTAMVQAFRLRLR